MFAQRKENVVNFLGSSCMGLTCADSEYAKRSIEVLLNSSKTKQHDVQPVVGEENYQITMNFGF